MKRPKGTIRAVIKTSVGKIRLNLFLEKTPLTVANFVNLAKFGFYDGIKFHRVIDEFMIQTGCPLGQGTGGPGYQFEDECREDLPHDKPGVLSMANSGPCTNGSQFFITHVATPWLDGKHTVFGEVVGEKDQNIVNQVAQDDVIETITIDGEIDSVSDDIKDRVAEWNEQLMS